MANAMPLLKFGHRRHQNPARADRSHGLQEEHEGEAPARHLVLDTDLRFFDADFSQSFRQLRVGQSLRHQLTAEQVPRDPFPIVF